MSVHEYLCFDPDWERINSEPAPRSEDDWWDRYCGALDVAESRARKAAEESAELMDFDSDEEREAYIEEVYKDRLAELLNE